MTYVYIQYTKAIDKPGALVYHTLSYHSEAGENCYLLTPPQPIHTGWYSLTYGMKFKEVMLMGWTPALFSKYCDVFDIPYSKMPVGLRNTS